MIARQIAVACVLFVAMLFALISAIGVLRSRNNLAALHCAGVSNVVVPPLLLIAVLVATGFGVSAVKTVVMVAILLLAGPMTTHAIAVAEHRRNPRL